MASSVKVATIKSLTSTRDGIKDKNRNELIPAKKRRRRSSACETTEKFEVPEEKRSKDEDIITSISPCVILNQSDFYAEELDNILSLQSQFILQAQKKQHNFKQRDVALSRDNQKSLPLKTRRTPEYTVVLDLDETLVHASLSKIPGSEITFEVELPDNVYTVYAKKRPGLMNFLKRCSERYELVLFTASKKIYADKLISLIDPDKKFIRHRMYRDHCRQLMLNYIKDLSVLGRDMKKTIIVDNSPQAFSFQVNNGIPIRSWFGSGDDQELSTLERILESLTENNPTDIRETLKTKFRLQSRIDRLAEE